MSADEQCAAFGGCGTVGHTINPTASLRWKKLCGTEILEQASVCIACGKVFWEPVPSVSAMDEEEMK